MTVMSTYSDDHNNSGNDWNNDENDSDNDNNDDDDDDDIYRLPDGEDDECQKVVEEFRADKMSRESPESETRSSV